MTLDAEVLLLPALLAFYAKDCLLLLDPDEGVLERRGQGDWLVAFGSRNYTLFGRQPIVLNPLTPYRPTYRLHWSMSQSRGATSAWTADSPQALLAMRAWPVAIALSLFGLVPFALYAHQGLPALLAAVGLTYALILGAVAHAWLRRGQLEITGPALGRLSAEVALCPPYAVNVIRKISILKSPAADLLETARVRIRGEALATVHRECAEHIARQLETEEEGTPRSAELAYARQSILDRVRLDEPS
jgi:hypothetical protein